MGRGRGGREKGLSEIPEFREEGGEEPVYRDRMDLGPTITDPAVTALVVTRELVTLFFFYYIIDCVRPI